MGNIFFFNWEIDLILFIQNSLMNSSIMNILCVIFTYFGEPIIAVLILGTIYWAYDKKFGVYLAVNALTSAVCNTLLKNIFFRIRPYMADTRIKCLKVVDSSGDMYDIAVQGYSFPSGHSMNVANYTSSIYMYLKKNILLVLGIIITSLTCFSRFALGVHFPTDTIVGALTGLLICLLINYLYSKISVNKLLVIFSIVCSVGLFYCKSNDYFQCYGILLGFSLANLYENKYVNFENTKNKLRMFIRTSVGCLLFLGISKTIKYILPSSIVYSNDYIGFMYQFVRYFISTFIIIGFYPRLFKYNLFKFK